MLLNFGYNFSKNFKNRFRESLKGKRNQLAGDHPLFFLLNVFNKFQLVYFKKYLILAVLASIVDVAKLGNKNNQMLTI